MREHPTTTAPIALGQPRSLFGTRQLRQLLGEHHARLINIPARIARSAPRLGLHLPRNWLWATSWQCA